MRKYSILILSTVLLAGCLKDRDYEKNKYGLRNTGDSPAGVGFAQALNRINVTSIENISAPQTFQIALVNLLSDVAAEQDIHVKIKLEPAIVSAYNANNAPDLEALPSTAYSIPSMTVTIPRGERTATLTLNIPDAKQQLDILKSYGLGFQIESVQEAGVTIASNLRNILVGVSIKNAVDGIYSMRGYTLRAGDPAKTGLFDGEEVSLITAGATAVDFGRLQVWADGSGVSIGEPNLFIDPLTNKVTVSSSGGAYNLPGYDSRYDPATRTFYVGFSWGGGPASRAAIDTLVYLRPRP